MLAAAGPAPLLGRYSAHPNGTVPRAPTATETPIWQFRSSPASPSTSADAGGALALLRKPGVVEHPRLHVNHRRDPLDNSPHHLCWIPGAVGEELLID